MNGDKIPDDINEKVRLFEQVDLFSYATGAIGVLAIFLQWINWIAFLAIFSFSLSLFFLLRFQSIRKTLAASRRNRLYLKDLVKKTRKNVGDQSILIDQLESELKYKDELLVDIKHCIKIALMENNPKECEQLMNIQELIYRKEKHY